MGNGEIYEPTYSPYGDLLCKSCYKEDAEEDDFQRYNRGQGQLTYDAESESNSCDVCETNKLLFEMTDMAANEVLCQSCIQDGHDSHWTIKTHIPETFPVDSEAYKTPKTEVGYTVGNGAESAFDLRHIRTPYQIQMSDRFSCGCNIGDAEQPYQDMGYIYAHCATCGVPREIYPAIPHKDAENMSPQVFGKLVGQYPQPPNNPSAVGGFMDDGFEWTVNQAETFNADLDLSNCTFCKKYAGNPFYMVDGRYAWEKVPACVSCKDKLPDEAWKKLNPVKYGAETGLEAITEPEVFGASSIVSKVKHNWLNSLIGLGVALVGYDYLKKKTFNSDTLIENPNTGDLKPADYEELIVESTGYVVPIIPVGLDGSFMGSRFHALPTDRYIYDSPEGIGAHIDIAMNRNTTFLPNEQSLVQASEAPGQSPYNSILPNGQENKDFPLRVIHETTTVSLDAGVAPYLPTDLSGYTGQQFIPTSVYEDMLNIGISGQIPAFKTPITQEVGANHFGSRIANPDMLANVGGPLKESVNGDYTDGNNTMTLSQWSIENQVQQISDTEALVIERGSGLRKMIRRV